MHKVYIVSKDLRVFIILRSVLAGMLVSLLVFLFYAYILKDYAITLSLLTLAFSSWLLVLTYNKFMQLRGMRLHYESTHLAFQTPDQPTKKLLWQDVQRVEISYTPFATHGTLILFTKSDSFPLHLYQGFDSLWENVKTHLPEAMLVQTRMQIWGKEFQLLVSAIFSFLIVSFALSLTIAPESFSLFYFAAFGAGVFFILYRPISQLISEMITQVEVGMGSLAILAFVFHLTSSLVVPYLDELEQARLPCGSESEQLQCYRMPAQSCKKIWKNLEVSCREDLKEVLSNRSPSALVGPIISKCQKKKFDKNLTYSRVKNGTSMCQNYFAWLERR